MTDPWPQTPASRSHDLPSGWVTGLAMGIDESALILANEPLGAPDSAALRTFIDRHCARFAIPHIHARLLCDRLTPGHFAAELDPMKVSVDVFPPFLERLERYGAERLCPDGLMVEEDRAALMALLLALGGPYDMRAPWDDYQRRAERLCRRPL